MSSKNKQLPPPTPFNFQKIAEWPEWLKTFEKYRLFNKLDGEEDDFQIDVFLYTMGDMASDIFRSFRFREDEEICYNNVKRKFQEFFARQVQLRTIS